MAPVASITWKGQVMASVASITWKRSDQQADEAGWRGLGARDEPCFVR
jgi:hypothetical protein